MQAPICIESSVICHSHFVVSDPKGSVKRQSADCKTEPSDLYEVLLRGEMAG